MMSASRYPPRSWQFKYPMKASKLQLLEFVAFCRGVDLVTVAAHFNMSESGARVKLWRLVKQGLLELMPDAPGPTKAWDLTRAGWRNLRRLQEAEQYGGTRGLLVSSLTAKVARLEAENEQWKKVTENPLGIVQEANELAQENLALRRDLAALTKEMQRVRRENEALRAAVARKYSH